MPMRLPYDIVQNVTYVDMQTATMLIEAVASGRRLLQMICSPSGFGKTAIAKARFKRHGIVEEMDAERRNAMRRAVQGLPPFVRDDGTTVEKRIFIEARPTKPISLLRVLYRCKLLNAAALLFDDPGRIAGNEDCCDILKTGFGVQRRVSFETPEITRNEEYRVRGHRSYDPLLPSIDFDLPPDLRWLWLANSNFADPAFLAKLGDHFAPLIARGMNPFWIRDDREHDCHDLFLYVLISAES